jgi:hypothetical protein
MPIQKITTGVVDASVFSSPTISSPTISGNLSLDSTGTTGVRVPSANTMTFHTAGTEDMRITSNGWVGVGTTTPANTFTVKGTGIVAERDVDTDRLITTYNDINVFANASGGTNHNAFTIRHSNNSVSNNRLRVTATGLFQFDSGYGDIATAYGCRAWVNFDGTTNVGGFCTIRASGGVTSITDNGTGDYTINFSFTFPDANYAVVVGAGIGSDSARIVNSVARAVPTTTAARFKIQSAGGSDADAAYTYAAVFR